MNTEMIEALQGSASDLFVRFAAQVVAVIVLLFAAWILAGWLSRLTRRAMQKAQLDETLIRFFSKMIGWLIMLLAVLACLGVFGVPTTSFAAVIGAAGLAIGLAFQGTLGNFAAGIMLLIFRPFNVADVINAAGQLGKVDAIDLFTTTIDTFDNRRIIIPNGSIFNSVIENISHHAIRRVDVGVGTDYAADLDQTRQVLEESVRRVAGGLDDPDPAVVLLALGGSSIDWSVRLWCDSSEFGNVRQALTREVKVSLDQAGIGIPFPQMDVHLDQAATR